MAYTLTQAKALLTAAELVIFDQSRAGPIKDLTASRLTGKVARARALRDKFKDLYRRQTVKTRGASAGGRAAAGGDNERTQKKATIFAEVLERFEARLAQLSAKTTAAGAKRPPAPAPRKAAAKPAVKAKKAAPRKTASKGLPAGDRAPAKRTARKAKPITLKTAVKQALELKQASITAPVVDERSSKAPSSLSPQGAAVAGAPPVTAPLDINPRAARLDPLKERGENIALHAHAGAQNRHAQGKRDSR